MDTVVASQTTTVLTASSIPPTAIAHAFTCSRDLERAAPRTFAIQTTTNATAAPGATSISTPAWMTVLGKTREHRKVSLLEHAATRLERDHCLLNQSADWPVFPGFHPPNMYAHVREQAAGDGETERESDGGLAVMRDHDIAAGHLATADTEGAAAPL